MFRKIISKLLKYGQMASIFFAEETSEQRYWMVELLLINLKSPFKIVNFQGSRIYGLYSLVEHNDIPEICIIIQYCKHISERNPSRSMMQFDKMQVRSCELRVTS